MKVKTEEYKVKFKEIKTGEIVANETFKNKTAARNVLRRMGRKTGLENLSYYVW